MDEEQKIHKTKIGNIVIEIIYIGELLGINIPNANIDYGLSQDLLKEKEVLDQGIKPRDSYGRITHVILLFLGCLIFILSIYFKNLLIFKIISLILPILLGAAISKLLNIKSVAGMAVLIIFFLAISLYLQNEININQIMDLCNSYLGKKP